jgi:NADH-quinone oxidoreductase subunit M
MLFDLPILSLVVWVPIVAGIAVLATGSDRNARAARWLALLGSLLGLLVALPLWGQFDPAAHGFQFQEMVSWIPRFNIHYHLGIDGISLLLILLNCITTVLVVIAGWKVIETRVAQYMAAFLVLSGLMNGVFCALDAALFYVFFEATLIPMFIIIGVWGGPNRVYAALKFFLYTLLGSLLTLVALIYLYQVSGGSFSLLEFHRMKIELVPQVLVFLAFFLAFAVKVPMWPVHTWLPDAHVEAPTGGSVVLAAIMLKLGGYGFVRLSLPIAPDASHVLAGFVIALSLIAVVYIGLVALVQNDMKKLIAYSSISHMGFVTLGIFIFNPLGMEGAVLQMISHGFVSCSCAWACSTTACTRARSRTTAAWSTACRCSPRCSCCSPWPTPGSRGRAVSSASSWSSWARSG